MHLKWVKLIHVNTCIERVLYSKIHPNRYRERERVVLLGCYATFVLLALTFWDSV